MGAFTFFHAVSVLLITMLYRDCYHSSMVGNALTGKFSSMELEQKFHIKLKHYILQHIEQNIIICRVQSNFIQYEVDNLSLWKSCIFILGFKFGHLCSLETPALIGNKFKTSNNINVNPLFYLKMKQRESFCLALQCKLAFIRWKV